MPGRPPATLPPFVTSDVKPANWTFGAPLQHARLRCVLQPGGSGAVLLDAVVMRPFGARYVAEKLEPFALVQL
jgi:hypothetical protein